MNDILSIPFYIDANFVSAKPKKTSFTNNKKNYAKT